MKKILTTVALVTASIGTWAQTGMDNDALFGPANHFSRLDRQPATANWERAMGVYQSSVLPVSYLEVNTNFSHITNPLPGLARPQVFSTNSPGSGFWRLRISNIQRGMWFNPGGLNAGDFMGDATTGDFIFQTLGTNRMWLKGTGNLGYLGLNNATPAFHCDAVTPAFLGGELFFGANPSDVPGSKIGFINGAFGNAVFLPIVVGNVDATQTGPGLQTLGNIDPSQDIGANTTAITRFVSSRGLIFNTVGAQPVQRRHLFSWGNAGAVHMLMPVTGRLRIMENLNTAVDIPNNRVEITSSAGDPYFGSVNGSSGLRLTNMTTANTPATPAPGQGVLSVDANGDVVYVTCCGSTGGALGNPCPAGTNPLTTDWEIPMNDKNFVFSDPGSGALANGDNFVGIGTAGCTPLAKLDVFRNSLTGNPFTVIAGRFINVDMGLSTPFAAQSAGVFGQVRGSNKDNIGVWGDAIDGSANTGVFATAIGNFVGGPANSVNYGVRAQSANAVVNYGIESVIFGSNASTTQSIGGSFNSSSTVGVNYGVFATVPTNSGGTGSGSPSPASDLAGYFNGDVLITNVYGPSDKNLKKDIKTIVNATELINKLNPVTYLFDTDNNKNINLPGEQQYGFISQEVEKILPELTAVIRHPAQYDEKGKEIAPAKEYLGLNYQNFIAILAKGMQEQQKQIEELKSLLEERGANGADINQQDIELSDKDFVVLNQNVPNPFAEKTMISYSIPASAGTAQILFYNEIGQLIKTVDIRTKGKGQINVFANDLSNGVYSYTLIVDGKVIDTKKMVKTQ